LKYCTKESGVVASFRGNKTIIKVTPYYANRAFACELFLKIIISLKDGKIRNDLHTHDLYKLYEMAKIKIDFIEFLKKHNIVFSEIDTKIKSFANSYIELRYLHERDNYHMENAGVLVVFCDFLDLFLERCFKERYNFDVSKVSQH